MGLRLVAAATVMAALISVAPSLPAGAHEGSAGLANVVDDVSPAAPGLTVAVVASVADELTVENRGPETVSVPDPGGRPFLEIGPGGVSADVNDPYWYASNNPGGVASIPASVTTSPEPRWVRIAAEPAWGWFDSRLPGRAVDPPARPAPGTVARLATWSIPLSVAGRSVQVNGHLEYSPPTGSVRARMTEPVPASSGLAIQVVAGGRAPAVFATWSGSAPATILGEQGEPFIRFSAAGVEANTASPTWRAALQARGQTPEPSTDATLRWNHLDDAPRLSWVDPRLTYAQGVPPTDVQARPESSVLIRWSLPVEVGSEHTSASGVTEWVPDRVANALTGQAADARPGAARTTQASRIPSLLRVLAIAAIVIALGWGLWRRSRAAR